MPESVAIPPIAARAPSAPAGRVAANLAQGAAPTLSPPTDTEQYADLAPNPVVATAEQPVSTFSIDVDTGAYSNVRRFLLQGNLPPTDAVRVEELINYFDYDYPRPESLAQPFSVHTEVAQAPWNPKRWLLKVGLQGFEVPFEQLPASNLVFLVDVSGSMMAPNKLPLVKTALKLAVEKMRPQDRIAIVVYAGAAGLVLPSTPASDKASILAALDTLEAGGSTNGGQGIQLAYEVARQHYVEGGVNRVILATDGDFNVGLVDQQDLEDLITRQRQSGVALTTLGFGQGNYHDQVAERLANLGNGNHAYIDTEREAQKVLVRELGANLLTIAKDVKIQVEFNPAVVAEYRLIGYENRLLAREDFNNDAVDAGEIGAGHTVTALYELTPVGSDAARLPPLRYATPAPAAAAADEIGFLKLRYKQPQAEQSQLIEQPIARPAQIGAGSASLRFAAAVAGFGETLRGGKYLDGWRPADIATLARAAEGRDPYGLQAEFVELVERAAELQGKGGGSQQIAR
jgi:Ca-activated chloride channel family protein